MRHDLIVSQSIAINAVPAKVWNALTDPEIIKEYFFGTETLTDWKVGSEIIFQGHYENQQYRDRGIILENIFHNTIRYSYWSVFSGLDDKPENYSIVTYSLSQHVNNQTTLTWTQQGFANEAGFNHSASGMDAFLNSIKEIIER